MMYLTLGNKPFRWGLVMMLASFCRKTRNSLRRFHFLVDMHVCYLAHIHHTPET